MPAKTVSETLIQRKIMFKRGMKVMLDKDLAELYGVSTKALNQAVKRNLERFPKDFMFQLSWEELDGLRSQIVTLEKRGRHLKYRPYAFTEQGVAMLPSVLKSKRAVLVNITIMRVFVKIREILFAHKELSDKLKELAGEEGLNFDQLFKKAIDESSSIQEIRSRAGSINQAVELIGAVVEKRLGGVEEPIVDVQLEPAS